LYDILGFANKYVEKNGAVPIFVASLRKSLEMKGYEIHFRWAVINYLPWMNSGIKGEMVIFPTAFYITLHFIP
jgi:hypothetical protein